MFAVFFCLFVFYLFVFVLFFVFVFSTQKIIWSSKCIQILWSWWEQTTKIDTPPRHTCPEMRMSTSISSHSSPVCLQNGCTSCVSLDEWSVQIVWKLRVSLEKLYVRIKEKAKEKVRHWIGCVLMLWNKCICDHGKLETCEADHRRVYDMSTVMTDSTVCFLFQFDVSWWLLRES